MTVSLTPSVVSDSGSGIFGWCALRVCGNDGDSVYVTISRHHICRANVIGLDVELRALSHADLTRGLVDNELVIGVFGVVV